MITTRRVTTKDFNEDKIVRDYLLAAAASANVQHGNKFQWINFPINYFDQHYANMAFKDGEPVGFMLAMLTRSIFDPHTILLRQDLMWVPGSSYGVSRRLLLDFIDFGRLNAHHILTMRGAHTNIKASSLERLGFKELETLYRMEV